MAARQAALLFMPSAKSIFIAHPSVLLTDHLTHGDALTAFHFIRRLADRGHRLNVVAEHVALCHPLPANVTVWPIPPRRPRSPIDQIACARRIRATFERVHAVEPVDIIHQLNPVALGLSCLLPEDKPPLVLGPYVPDWPPSVRLGEDASPLKQTLYLTAMRAKQLIRRREQGRASALLLSTPAAESKLALSSRSHALIRYLSPGVDIDVFREPRAAAPAGATILFLANLNVRKGILTLLEAFESVATRLPGAELHIAGEGAASDQVRAIIAGSPHRDQITLLGRVAPSDVPALMAAADVFCLPSRAEPFGISVLEAMACARPVVATGVGGMVHLVRDEGGRTVAPDDANALAGALVEVLGSPALRESMGAFNRALVEERYGWERVIDGLEAIYDEVTTHMSRYGRKPARR